MKIKNIYLILMIILMINVVTASSNTFIPTPRPVTTSTSGNLFSQPDNIINNYIIINVTNNITNIVTNNITTNYTNIVNTYFNLTNNITNNIFITNDVINNITNFFNITEIIIINITSENFYNISNFVFTENNITNIINNNFTNNIYVNISLSITDNSSSNITANFNIFNITQNFTIINNITQNFTIINNITQNFTTINNITITNNVTTNIVYAYSEIYNNSQSTQTLTTQNVYYNISGFSDNEQLNWIYNANYLQCNNTGVYLISYSLTDSVTANNNLFYRMVINDVEIPESIRSNAHNLNNPLSISHLFIKTVNKGDNVSLQVNNSESSGRVLTIINKNILATIIGN